MQGKYPKILVISAWYPNSLHGAEGDFIKYQSELMYHEGMDISIFHASMSIRYLLKGKFKRTETLTDHGIKEHIVEKPFWPRNNSLGIKRWQQSFKNEIQKHCEVNGWPDIIHAHTYLGGSVASLIKEEYNIPYVLTLHETRLISQSTPEYHFTLIKKAFSNADEIVAVGAGLKKALKKWTTQNCSVIPNFIDFEKFTIAPTTEKHKTFTFVFIGELILRKRVNKLLNAFNRLSKDLEAQLLIIGDGPISENLKSLAGGLYSKNKIHFKGRLPQTAVANALRKSHCLVLPSNTETFGIVLAEAMACGLPFISSMSGVPIDLFSHESCHFISCNEDSLVNEMTAVYNASYNSDKIRSFAQGRFSAKSVVAQYRNLFLSVLR